MILNENLFLNEKYGDIPQWLKNRLNAVKPMAKTGDINPKFANTEYGNEIKPEYTPKWSKENPGIYSLYDQLINAGYDLANMRAEERPIPTKQSDLKDIENRGLFPVWLLKGKDTNKTQIYIQGINDTEKTLYKNVIKNYRFLSRLPFKDLVNDSIRFAVLDIPMKDQELQAQRQEWGDEATGWSGKQRNPEYAGISTTNKSIDFDKSGYNVAPNRERLKQGAEELRKQKDELRKNLSSVLKKIADAKENTEEVIEEVPEVAQEEDANEIENELKEVWGLFKRAEFITKSLILDLDEFDEEEIINFGLNLDDVYDFADKIIYYGRILKNIRNNAKKFKGQNVELTLDGDWIDNDTGEVYETEKLPIELISINLETIIDSVKNYGLQDLDWE